MGQTGAALVFAGGGGKGAYEIGVWQAMKECGLEGSIQSVIGTSVGALNALLFGQQNIDMARRIWREISYSKMMVSNIGGRGALTSQEGLKNLLQANLTGRLQKYVYVCCSRVEAVRGGWEDGYDTRNYLYQKKSFLGLKANENLVPEYIKLNDCSRMKQMQYLLASSALPAVYDSVYVDGKEYRDGGIIHEHNMPYGKAVELGYQRVLAVSLECGISGIKTVQGSKVFTLSPSQSLGDVIDGTIDFDAGNVEWRMNLGYSDFMRYKNEIVAFLGENRKASGIPDYIRVKFKKMV